MSPASAPAGEPFGALEPSSMQPAGAAGAVGAVLRRRLAAA